MRVISGRAKGRKLKLVPGNKSRPITDRVKENLFNILGDWIRGTIWLDLFAGTGQVGIEALSRGAKNVVFIDNYQGAIRIIRDNLRSTNLNQDATVILLDAFIYLKSGRYEPFDVIFIAPPQYKDLWEKVIHILDQSPKNYLTPEGMIIVQIDPKEFKEIALEGLHLFDTRRYGRTMLCFYEPSDSMDT